LPTSPAALRLSLPYLTAQAARPREPWTLKHIERSVNLSLFAPFHFLFSTTGGAENGLPSPYFVPVHDDYDDYSPILLGPSPLLFHLYSLLFLYLHRYRPKSYSQASSQLCSPFSPHPLDFPTIVLLARGLCKRKRNKEGKNDEREGEEDGKGE